jgi:ferredoxin-NADP reductase
VLTAEAMLGSKGRDSGVWVYMCGPPPMTAALAKGFLRLGVPSGRIRWEQFDVR